MLHIPSLYALPSHDRFVLKFPSSSFPLPTLSPPSSHPLPTLSPPSLHPLLTLFSPSPHPPPTLLPPSLSTLLPPSPHHPLPLSSSLLNLIFRQDMEKAISAMENAISVDNSCVQAYDTLASLELQRWVCIYIWKLSVKLVCTVDPRLSGYNGTGPSPDK